MIYLDNAATSHPKPPAVVNAMLQFLTEVGASPGRAGHRLSAQAARIVFEAREAAATLFGVSDSRNILFTSGATHSLNLALFGILKKNDHVVATSMEHNSVMRPLRHLVRERDIRLSIAHADRFGRVSADAVRDALEPDTRLVVINHGSNVTGIVQPIAQIKEAIGSIPLLVDAAQTAGGFPIDVVRNGIDLLAFSGHKSLLGPQGVGGLYIQPKLEIQPLLFGGTGSHSQFDSQPAFLPDKLESGTPNTPGIAGLGEGIRTVLAQGVNAVHEKEMMLYDLFMEQLRRIPNITRFGADTPGPRLPTVSFNLCGKPPSEVGRLLDKHYEIMVRVGLHCAPTAHQTLGSFPDGTVRISLGFLNTTEDIYAAAAALTEIAGR